MKKNKNWHPRCPEGKQGQEGGKGISPFFEGKDSNYYFAEMSKSERRLVFLEAMRSFFEDEW